MSQIGINYLNYVIFCSVSVACDTFKRARSMSFLFTLVSLVPQIAQKCYTFRMHLSNGFVSPPFTSEDTEAWRC